VTATERFSEVKLQLARVIGLPIGQEFALSDQIPFVPVPEMSMQEALERAHRDRPDYLAAQERVRAEEARRQAAVGEMVPSVHVNADWGAIGLTPGTARSTFTASASMPIFQEAPGAAHGGRAELRTTRAGLRSAPRFITTNGPRFSIAVDRRAAAGRDAGARSPASSSRSRATGLPPAWRATSK
jgi:outer membrane protein TolC